MNLLRPERLHALAREHALGTLRGPARRRFERLLLASPAARLAVAHWQEQFAALAGGVVPLAPREQVWQGLQQRLGFVPKATPAKPSRWRWLEARWLGAALAGALVATIGTTLLLQSNPGWVGHETLREDLPPSYVGLLSDGNGRPAVLLSSRRHGRVLTAKLLQPLAAPPGDVAVLWAFPKNSGTPFVVGSISIRQGSAALPLSESAEKLFFHVERLGIAFQPDAAAPQPGVLVLAGPCVKLW